MVDGSHFENHLITTCQSKKNNYEILTKFVVLQWRDLRMGVI